MDGHRHLPARAHSRTRRHELVTVAALAGYLFASLLRRFGTPFIVLDAMATSLFTVAGVEKALLYDLPYVSAIFIGVAAGVGDGLFVDLVAGHPWGWSAAGPGTLHQPGFRTMGRFCIPA